MKTCPYCIAEIPDEARKCRYCGEWVEPVVGDGPAAAAAGADRPAPVEWPAARPLDPPAAVAPAKPCRMCGAPFPPGSVLCVRCGYDTRTGRIRPGVGNYRPRADGVRHSLLAHYARQLALVALVLCAVAAAVEYWTDPPAAYTVGGLAAAGLLAGLTAAALAVAGLIDVARDGTRTRGGGAALLGLGLAAVAGVGSLLLGLTAVGHVYQARQEQAAGHLKQVGVALHHYHDQHGRLPPPAVRDKDGRPLLSWRVALLPYLEHDALYREFRLDEPWDSPHNRRLLDRMPAVYAPPGRPGGSETHVLAAAGQGTAFEGPDGARLSAISDGTSNTILVVTAAAAVPWTKPDDLDYRPDGPVPPLGYPVGACPVLLADGSVRFLGPNAPESTVRALLTRNGGEAVSHDR